MSELDLHGDAAARFTTAVDAIGPHWDAATPCSDWTVRQLVNHLAAEQLWVPDLLAGRTIEEVGDHYDGDVLGDDPVATWHTAMTAARQAWTAPGATDQLVHLSFGDAPAAIYLSQMVLDLAVHAWDLATALRRAGVDIDPTMDPETVTYLLAVMAGQADELAASGLFAPALDVAAGASGQTRLLALLGRKE